MKTTTWLAWSLCAILLAALLQPPAALGQENEAEPLDSAYLIQPGDLLEVSVWKEDYLQRDVLVRPDGGVTFPLAGDVDASERTVEEVRAQLSAQLARYIPDPVVTVSVKEIRGHKIYVLGQVQRPGAFVMNPRVDIMQALALAGGATAYAALNDIKVIRRTNDGQRVIEFRYGEVEKGRNLRQNVILESGDIIVVP